jgi:hypothetical protein
MARAGLTLGAGDLDARAGVAPGTVARIEAGQDVDPAASMAVVGALEAAGVVFSDRGDGLITVGVPAKAAGETVSPPRVLRPDELNASNDI